MLATKVKAPRQKTKLKPSLDSFVICSVQMIVNGSTSRITSEVILKMQFAHVTFLRSMVLLGLMLVFQFACIGCVPNASIKTTEIE